MLLNHENNLKLYSMTNVYGYSYKLACLMKSNINKKNIPIGWYFISWENIC